jgi:hypothetical protein
MRVCMYAVLHASNASKACSHISVIHASSASKACIHVAGMHVNDRYGLKSVMSLIYESCLLSMSHVSYL